jgi:hypothetical protein
VSNAEGFAKLLNETFSERNEHRFRTCNRLTLDGKIATRNVFRTGSRVLETNNKEGRSSRSQDLHPSPLLLSSYSHLLLSSLSLLLFPS